MKSFFGFFCNFTILVGATTGITNRQTSEYYYKNKIEEINLNTTTSYPQNRILVSLTILFVNT